MDSHKKAHAAEGNRRNRIIGRRKQGNKKGSHMCLLHWNKGKIQYDKRVGYGKVQQGYFSKDNTVDSVSQC